MQQQFKMAAVAAAVLSTFNAYAGDQETVEPDVVVTATRFSDDVANAASNVTVITADNIRNSPVTNLPDLLKTAAGIDVRPLYGSLGIDTAVDLRGFGDTAQSNTLILLDGQRLNPIDSGSISWSAIPVNSIRRIEIIRGSGTVLYGDQATGGVINIITDKSGAGNASATLGVGSYGYRSGDFNFGKSFDGGYTNLALHYADTDGWRQNTQSNQQGLSGRTGILFSGGETFIDYAAFRDKSGLPGSLPSATYRSDPSSARTPFDSQDRDGYRLRPGFSYVLSNAITLEGELSLNRENYHGNNVSLSSTFDRTRDTWSLTPRVRWNHGLAGLDSNTVMGIDYYNGDVKAKLNGAPFITAEHQSASQKSTAVYAQNTTSLNDRWAMNLGARAQRMNQSANQSAYTADFGFGPFLSPPFDGSGVHTRSAFDLGLVYQATGWRAYGKTGSTFRFPNTDELFGFDPLSGNPIFAGDLKPQHGTIAELGANFEGGAWKGKASIYTLKLNDEIGFDGTANVNLPGTRRNGLETEVRWAVTPTVLAKASYTYTDATFREGPNSGKGIPLVAKNKAGAQVTWHESQISDYSVVVNYVGDRRYSGDFANIRGELSGYTTVDLQGSWDLKPWTVTAKLLNAFNQRYAPFALYSTFRADYFYYPADARSVFVSAAYQFK